MAKIDVLISQAQTHFEPGEPVLASVMGGYETKVMGGDTVRTGVFVATDRRLVFYAKKMFGYDFESIPYANISSMEMSKEFMGYTLTFFVSGNRMSMKWIHGDVRGLVDVVKEQTNRRNSPSPSTPRHPSLASGGDLISQLERLGKLHESGILTDEEFALAKRDILASNIGAQSSARSAEPTSFATDGAPSPDAVPDPRLAEVYRHLRAGSLIQAIAAYQRATGLGLVESKSAVERMAGEIGHG